MRFEAAEGREPVLGEHGLEGAQIRPAQRQVVHQIAGAVALRRRDERDRLARVGVVAAHVGVHALQLLDRDVEFGESTNGKMDRSRFERPMLGPACDNGATDGVGRAHGRVDPHLQRVLAQLGSPARRAHRGDEPRRAARSRAGAAAAAVARRGWRVHRARRRRRGRHLDRGEGLRSRPRAAEPSGARRLRSRPARRGGTPDQPRPAGHDAGGRSGGARCRTAPRRGARARMRRSGCSSRGRRCRRGCSPGTESHSRARRLDPRLGFLTSSSWNPRAVIPARHARFRAFARRHPRPTRADLTAFHAQADDPRGTPWAICMARDDARTVSTTVVDVGPSGVAMRYRAR